MAPARGAPAEAGVSFRLEDLIALRPLASRLRALYTPPVVSTAPAGQRSPLRGRGVDYEETRPYQPGDDVRNIDWRVTARTGEPHTKIYREERERTLLVVTDVGPAMRFATRRAFKSVVAAECAALLAWAAAERGDRVGALVCGPDHVVTVSPQPRERGALALLTALVEAQGTSGAPSAAVPSRLAEALEAAGSMARADVRLIVLADLGPAAGPGRAPVRIRTGLEHCAAHSRTSCGWVVDPIEHTLPAPGDYPVSDGSRRWTLRGVQNSERRDYRHRYEARVETLRAELETHAVELFFVSTADAPVEALHEVFLRSPAFL